MARHIPVLLAFTVAASAYVFAATGKPPAGSSVGAGTVFLPNPVADLGDQTLTDRKDADYPALAPAYHDVALTNLDGSGFLVGNWAQIASETGDPAYSASNEFRYHRNDDRFEQVMAYYWITEAQEYIQSLGFGTVPAAGEHEVTARPHQPVGRRQLVRHRPQGRTPIRQGRRGRCRGRRGDPARIRARDPFLTEASSSVPKRPARSARALATTGRSR